MSHLILLDYFFLHRITVIVFLRLALGHSVHDFHFVKHALIY